MKRKTVKTKTDLNQVVSEQADNVAENYRKIYEAFQKKDLQLNSHSSYCWLF